MAGNVSLPAQLAGVRRRGAAPGGPGAPGQIAGWPGRYWLTSRPGPASSRVALAWTLLNPAVTAPVIGARSGLGYPST
ncbi:MAG: hypothetical protein WAL72_08515 [Streptosporangiaceae bacterium]